MFVSANLLKCGGMLSSTREVIPAFDVSERSRKRHGSSTEGPCHRYCATPRSLTKLVSNSNGSRGQQECGAKRNQHKSRPIRFDPKAASRSFRFQCVTGSPGAKPPSTT